MSTRRTPEELSDQLNALEEQFRRLQAQLATTPTDVRQLFDARGDLIVGFDDDTPQRLGRGAAGAVLTSDPTALLGLAWEVLDAIRASLLTQRGALVVAAGEGVAGQLLPENDGDVLTLDSTAPLGVAWAASTESDAEVLAWLSMAMAS